MTGRLLAPIVVTGLMGGEDFAWLDRQRRAYYPPDRNVLPAHLTLFRHLPPSTLGEVAVRIKTLCASPPPKASLAGVLLLEHGVAYRVESPALMDIWLELADAFSSLLVPQDLARPRLHVTVQNKVTAKEARALAGRLKAGFRPRPLAITGLAVWHYRGGPWELAARSCFRG
ncbi:2'-5' RNA ligase family protein [Sphingobium cloacae]|uniref:2'-5' RNA ligase n=1 Tax=Sphingobium cloacae TaxID=120107 RepID=A0A1E1F191_9SPHN|nr:2'-5' RNA ligase family protein [Sphingobium cloacae]BAV64270.1 hypothetical protein SCLO_1012300 [Sphingobium cloacae]